MAVTTRNGAFIGGDSVAGDGEEIEVRSPGTGELLGTVVGSSPAQVERAVGTAAAAFETWRRSGTGRELAGWIVDALTETKQITFDLS